MCSPPPSSSPVHYASTTQSALARSWPAWPGKRWGYKTPPPGFGVVIETSPGSSWLQTAHNNMQESELTDYTHHFPGHLKFTQLQVKAWPMTKCQ